jgi:hypothetical protein
MGKYNVGLIESLVQRAVPREEGMSSSFQHRWVVGPDEDPGPHPGLMIDWVDRGPDGGGWFGYAVWHSSSRGVQWGWVPAGRLKPLG